MKREEEQKPTKGDFKYNKEGNIVFKASETGRWNIATDKSFESLRPDENPIYRQGIDPYQTES